MEQPSTQPTTQFSNQPTTPPSLKKPIPNNPNKKPLLIGLVICIILAVAGIAFGIYGVISSNGKSSELEDLKSQITEKDQTIADLKQPTTPTTPTEPTETPTTPAPQTNSYSLFADNLSKNSTNISGHYYHYTGTENVQRTMLAEVKDGHLKITDLDDNNKLIAEADGIISVYFIHVGNGGTPYFYLIHKDGKISRICIAENVDRTIEALNDYSNIVSVFEGSDLFAYLVDINGNVYQTH